MKPKVITTAPRRIWLQVSEDEWDKNEPFPSPSPDITWCHNSVMDCEVEYIRADLVPPKIRKRIVDVTLKFIHDGLPRKTTPKPRLD